MRSTTITLALVAATLAACVRGDDASAASAPDVAQFVGKSPSAGASAMSAQPGVLPAAGGDVDPCTFFSKSEIEKAFGHPYGPPKKGTIMTGPHCMFYSVNTGTISIRAGEVMTRANFDEFRTALGGSAEPVSGIGETAFLWNGKLYVLNRGQQLVISVSGEMTPRWRAALLELGRLGAPRLGR